MLCSDECSSDPILLRDAWTTVSRRPHRAHRDEEWVGDAAAQRHCCAAAQQRLSSSSAAAGLRSRLDGATSLRSAKRRDMTQRLVRATSLTLCSLRSLHDQGAYYLLQVTACGQPPTAHPCIGKCGQGSDGASHRARSRISAHCASLRQLAFLTSRGVQNSLR